MFEYTSAMKGHLVSQGVTGNETPSKAEVRDAWAEHKKRMKASEIGN